jgi:hypothetical protein
VTGDPALRAALRRFERRAIVVSFVKTVSIAMLAVGLAAEVAALSGERRVWAVTALIAVALAGSAVYAVVRRPSLLALARRVDANGRLNDLIVTAIDRDGGDMAAMVRRAAIAALAEESPRRAIPFEASRRWRLWIAAAGVVQLAAVPMLFRAPAERAAASGLSALTMPAASGGPGVSGKSDRSNGASNPPTADASTGAVAKAPAEAAQAGAPVGSDGLTATARDDAAVGAPGNDDQLRLAIANADADMAAGHVPLARRALVQRYFAAIQSQRKPPR